MKWLILVVVVIANAVAVFFYVAPALITFVPTPPAGIHCGACSTSEVQTALAEAASLGRLQITAMISSYAWLIIAIAVSNICVCGLVLYRWRTGGSNAL